MLLRQVYNSQSYKLLVWSLKKPLVPLQLLPKLINFVKRNALALLIVIITMFCFINILFAFIAHKTLLEPVAYSLRSSYLIIHQTAFGLIVFWAAVILNPNLRNVLLLVWIRKEKTCIYILGP